jgi:hypothetical protein
MQDMSGSKENIMMYGIALSSCGRGNTDHAGIISGTGRYGMAEGVYRS